VSCAGKYVPAKNDYYFSSRNAIGVLIIINVADLEEDPALQDYSNFLRLDSVKRPGLTEIAFRKLFVKCGTCGLITTRQVFHFHPCKPDIVDLTNEAN
jgi:hypothetical protein